MKKILSFLLVLWVLPQGIYSQFTWSELTYHYQTGTVPPPYYYSYDLHINSSGDAQLIYAPSYSNDSNWVFNLKLTQDQISKLDEEINSSEVMTAEVKALPENKHPIGGPLRNIKIILTMDSGLDHLPGSITTPYFPEKKYKEKLDNLYKVVSSLVPQETWDEIKARKESKPEK